MRSCAMKATQKEISFKDALAEKDAVAQNLSKEELDSAMNPENYTGKAQEIVENLIKKYGD